MADNKKRLEDVIWEYIYSHRILKIAFLGILSVGSITGTITALETPYRKAVDVAGYVFGWRPKADDVVLERNAFVAGMLFRELWVSLPSSEVLKPDLDMLGKSLTAIGFGDAETKALVNENPVMIQSELLRIRQKLEGHLEAKGYRYKAFFDLGFHIRSLAGAATGFKQDGAVREINGLVLKAYSSAQDDLSYRLPALSLVDMKPDTPIPHDYIVSVMGSMRLLKLFLSVDI